jgi:hypothetical protein
MHDAVYMPTGVNVNTCTSAIKKKPFNYSSFIHIVAIWFEVWQIIIRPKLKYCLFAIRPIKICATQKDFFAVFKIKKKIISEIFVPVRSVFQSSSDFRYIQNFRSLSIVRVDNVCLVQKTKIIYLPTNPHKKIWVGEWQTNNFLI